MEPDLVTLPDLLRMTLDRGGSDLHLATGSPPRVRVNGRLERLALAILTPDLTRTLAYSVLTGVQVQQFEAERELDLAFTAPGVGRIRCHVFNEKGAVGMALRLVPEHVRTLEDLALPAALADLTERPRGLVLVAGPTGSGKSTTLAAMIDRINSARPVHILTIEDPIEYLHAHKQSLVTQREVHADTKSFGRALRAALREDPDVVLIGEMRDLETTEAALTLAETGHLTLATLHTNSAAQTIARIVDVFPAHQRGQIRTQLALVLEGVACQALLPRADGSGRVAAVELLVATPAIRSLIREEKLHQLYGAMQTSQGQSGMQTLNQALARLHERQLISSETALAACSNRDELRGLLRQGGQPVAANGRQTDARRVAP